MPSNNLIFYRNLQKNTMKVSVLSIFPGLLLLLPIFLYAQEKYEVTGKFEKKAIFEEEFNHNSNQWKLSDVYPLYSDIGRSRLTLHAEDFESKLVKKMRFRTKKDFEIEFSICWISGDSMLPAGLVYGAKKEKYYKIGLSWILNQLIIEKKVWDNNIPVAKTGQAEISREFFNKVTIRVVKKKMYIFLNEKLVLQQHVLKARSNEFGFFIPANSTYAIDYLNIYYLIKVKGKDKKKSTDE